MHAKLFKIVAAVCQLLGQCMLVHIGPVGAEQFLGVGNQCIEMMVALAFGFVVGTAGIRQAGGIGQNGSSRADVFLAMRGSHLLGHVAHVIALIGIGQERNIDAVLFEITQPG